MRTWLGLAVLLLGLEQAASYTPGTALTVVTALPGGSCTNGDAVILTSQSPAALYVCLSNVWQQVTGGLVGGPTPTSANTMVESGVKVVTGMTNNVATTILTVTVPNAVEAAMINVEVVSSIGAGGAIGAFESTKSVQFHCAVARTAGVNSVLACASVTQSSAAIVAGGANQTITQSFTTASGAVGAVNTHTITFLINRLSGSADNHQAVVYYRVLNSQANGVTVS